MAACFICCCKAQSYSEDASKEKLAKGNIFDIITEENYYINCTIIYKKIILEYNIRILRKEEEEYSLIAR